MNTTTTATTTQTSTPRTAMTPIATLQLILSTYTAAVAGLENLKGEELKYARNKLFYGGRFGTKVHGVNTPDRVKEMFQRIIMNGRHMALPTSYPDGRNVYCYDMSHHTQYKNKGRSSFVRVSDLADMGPTFLAAVEFAEKYDEATDSWTLVLQAPKVKPDDKDNPVISNIITIVMNKENTEFLEWYCGEPDKKYIDSDWKKAITYTGEFDYAQMWVHVGYNIAERSQEVERRVRQQQRVSQSENNQRRHPAAQMNSIGAAFEVAVRYSQPEEHNTAEQPAA